MNPSTAFATVLVDEFVRCGLREAVIAPGSRSAPLAMALHAATSVPGAALRLHVRIDERSASFLALGLAKASGRPAAVVCTSGTAAAHLHAAVIEADEACVPLLVLTADRPPELRGTGANQTIDQVKLYGGAVRWYCETGVAEDRPGQVGYWRSLASRAWSLSAGNGVASAGPVHLNAQFREPLVPAYADSGWSAPLDGRDGGAPWTRAWPAAPLPAAGTAGRLPGIELDWTGRGLVLCGDGTANPQEMADLAAAAGWPLLAEPSSGARHGPAALRSYQYLLDSADFLAAHRPDLIISAGRPGLSRGQLALLRCGGLPGSGGSPVRHVALGQPDARWADPARTATDVACSVRLRGVPVAGHGGPGREAPPEASWLRDWLAADASASAAADAVLAAAGGGLSEPLLARRVGAALPGGALLWVASSMPARDLDRHLDQRADVRVLANRGTSGIDGLVSSAIGAALAHQRAGGGPAVALLGDLAVLHDAPGLVIGPVEPRPDLCLIVVNNNGGGIFSGLEQAAFPESFERVFGTPHGADFSHLAAAAGLPYTLIRDAAGLADALAGRGLRLVEVRTDRDEQAALRAAIAKACAAAIAGP
ncbi:MAG: 2-succinyl-5-enolpyruvyl-6-hydroxy-3-cyclohexene-1-carboxylic-acid synthase [Streptosporangiaceae bacterium]